MTKSKTFVKLETAIPTKSQVDKGLNIVRDQLALDKQREDLKQDKQTLHDIFDKFFEGVPNWVNKVWNSPGNNPMDNTHYDVNMFARAYCGMLATPQYTEMLAFTNGLDDGKDKKTFTIYFKDKKAGKLITVDKEKTKSQWVRVIYTERKMAFISWNYGFNIWYFLLLSGFNIRVSIDSNGMSDNMCACSKRGKLGPIYCLNSDVGRG